MPCRRSRLYGLSFLIETRHLQQGELCLKTRDISDSSYLVMTADNRLTRSCIPLQPRPTAILHCAHARLLAHGCRLTVTLCPMHPSEGETYQSLLRQGRYRNHSHSRWSKTV